MQLSKQLKLTETQVKLWLTQPDHFKAKSCFKYTFTQYHTYSPLLDKIKIWFQNRRTKWKRKYTNDLELLAQQYYSHIGLGVLTPRPMFVGDRLW